VYLSKDAAITTLDTRIGYVTAAALSPGAEQTVTVSAAIPASLAPGTWYLGAIADAFSAVPEASESNNALAGNTLLVSGSDLAVVSVSGPALGLTGQTIPVTVTVRNLGPGAAPASSLYVYLSKDSAITTLDTGIGFATTAALSPGAEQTVTVSAAIPASLAGNLVPGRHCRRLLRGSRSQRVQQRPRWEHAPGVGERPRGRLRFGADVGHPRPGDPGDGDDPQPRTRGRPFRLPVRVSLEGLRHHPLRHADRMDRGGNPRGGCEQTVTVNAAIPASLARGPGILAPSPTPSPWSPKGASPTTPSRGTRW